MNRYLNNALVFDLLIVSLLGVGIFLLHPFLAEYFRLPSKSTIENITSSIISVGATLIGFLLTIITIIITFKKGYDDSKNIDKNGKVNFEKLPLKTIFGKTISKESQFYETPIHKRVTKVFIMATYEIGLVIFTLILIQFNILIFNELIISIIIMMFFIMLIITTIRSLNIFRLFLKVHSETSSS